MQGIVITKNANLFTVVSDGKKFQVMPSGKTKQSGIFAGDYVEFDKTITSVKKRKNLLIRPPLANLDKLFIVIASLPKPDFLLVDKMILYCLINGIKPIIVVNKIDNATNDFIESVKDIYSEYFDVCFVSAKDHNVSSLEKQIEGVCAMAGQSACGKSSIINALHDDEVALTGELSKRIERGKQTTRIVNLYEFPNGFLADTAGFSILDLSMVSDIDYRELSSYYPDFLQARQLCKYRSCLHNQKDCGVLQYLQEGKISQTRYDNYLKILNELKENKKY